MDEYSQDAPDYERQPESNTRAYSTRRGTKGNRVEQGKRYRLRYPSKYRDRMKRYMKERRALLREAGQ